MLIRILVLCTGNSCRSQMAEAYLKKFLGTKALVYSAGIEPQGINLRAIEIMREDGLEISNQTSNNVLEYQDLEFDFVITVCDSAKENCPYFPAKSKILHHSFSDPAKATGSEKDIIEQFRMVRDQIKNYCLFLSSDIIDSKK